MNRRLALKVFIIDKETSGKWIIKNKALEPWRALGTLFLIIHLPSVFIYYLTYKQASWVEHWSDKPEIVVSNPTGGNRWQYFIITCETFDATLLKLTTCEKFSRQSLPKLARFLLTEVSSIENINLRVKGDFLFNTLLVLTKIAPVSIFDASHKKDRQPTV